MFLGEFNQFCRAHHGAILTHNLTAQTNRLQICQTAQIHGSFGVAGANQHAAFACAQREHMTRAAEIGRLGVCQNRCAGGIAALFGGNTGGGVHVVNGYGERGLVVVGVLFDHRRQTQLVAVFAAHRHTDQTLGIGCHEVDVFCGCKLCSTDDVAFVFTIRIINDQNVFACTQGVQSFFNGCKISHFYILLSEKPVCRQKIGGQAAGRLVRFRRGFH